MQAPLKLAHKFRPALVAIALVAIALIAMSLPAALKHVHAQAKPAETIGGNPPQSSLNAQFQYSTITGTTNTITATYVPVTTTSGSQLYENLTIPFEVSQNSQGQIQVEAGDVTAVPSPLPQTGGFIAGNYVGPGGGTAQLITLSGPGVTSDGATEWTIAATAGYTECPWPYSTSFYVGPLASNPNYARIESAGITSNAYSYGIEGDQPCSSDNNNHWHSGSLLGFAQSGNTITIVTFTVNTNNANGGDSDLVQDQITYSLIQP